MRTGALAAAHAPGIQSIQRSKEDVEGPSKEFILKRLKSSPSRILDVGNSAKWLKLDRIHHDHVARVAQTEVEWILTPQANLFVAAVIAFQSFLLGAEVSLQLEAQQDGHEFMPLRWSIAFEFLDIVLLIFFTVEYALRCHSLKRRFATSCAGVIDLLLLVTGIFSTVLVGLHLASNTVSDQLMTLAQALRRLRILRIGRILAIFQALSMLIKGLVGTMVAIMDSMILIGMMSFVGALVCCEALGREEQFEDLFGSLGNSFLIHIQLVLVEAWPDIANVMMQSHPLWACYVICFLILSNFTILNVVTGVVCDGVLELASGKPPNSAQQQYLKLDALRDEIFGLYQIGPKDCRGQLDSKGYLSLLKSSEAQLLLDKLHIALPSAKDLQNLLDADHNQSISLEELQDGLMRLRGSQVNLDGLGLQCRLFRNFWSASAALWQAESRTKTMTRRAMEELSKQIDAMEITAFRDEENLSKQEQQMAQLQKVFEQLERLQDLLRDLCAPKFPTEQPPVSVKTTETQTEKSQGFASTRPGPLPPAPERKQAAKKGRGGSFIHLYKLCFCILIFEVIFIQLSHCKPCSTL